MKELSKDQIEYIIERVIKNAASVQDDRDKNTDESARQFYEGMLAGYHEVLDTIKTQLKLYDMDLKDFGLDIDIEKLTA